MLLTNINVYTSINFLVELLFVGDFLLVFISFYWFLLEHGLYCV